MPTLDFVQYQWADHDGIGMDVYSGWNSGSFVQNDTLTVTGDTSQSGGSSYALSEGGDFGGGSWGLSSYALLQQDSGGSAGGTITTGLSTQSGSYAGQRWADGILVYNLVGSFTERTPSNQTAALGSGTSFSLTEQGVFGGGSFNLSCFALIEQVSGTASLIEASTGTQTFLGTNTAGSSAATFSGLGTSSSGGQESSAASATLAEYGIYAGGSFALSQVLYSGTGSDSYASSDSGTAGWSGSYAGQDTSSDQAAGNDSYALAVAGSFSAGSFSLSSYVLQGASAGSYNSGDASQEWSSGSGGSGSGGSMGGGSTIALSSFSSGQSGQENDTLYQAGTQNSGGYSNGSYNYQDAGLDTSAEASWLPSSSASDTWTQQQNTQIEASGTSDLSSAATYTYGSSWGGSTLHNAGSGGLSGAVPNAALVQLAAPDVNLVPTDGAGQPSGGAAAAGAASGGAGGAAPVPVVISMQAVTDASSWLGTTGQLAGQQVSPAVANTSGASGGITLAGVLILAGHYLNGPGSYGLGGATAAALSDSFLPRPAAPTSAGYGVTAWDALTPVFGLLDAWASAGGTSASLQGQVQAMLGVHLPPSPTGGGSGDPFVDWVDQMLYNGGQPLTAGSAPLYGTYWDGMGHSAQEALSMAAPYVAGGVGIVAGMWMVGPSALAGVGMVADFALVSAGMSLAVNAAGGATPGMFAQGFGEAFFQGALEGSMAAVGELLAAGPAAFAPNSSASWEGALGRAEQRLSEGGALTEPVGPRGVGEAADEEGLAGRVGAADDFPEEGGRPPLGPPQRPAPPGTYNAKPTKPPGGWPVPSTKGGPKPLPDWELGNPKPAGGWPPLPQNGIPKGPMGGTMRDILRRLAQSQAFLSFLLTAYRTAEILNNRPMMLEISNRIAQIEREVQEMIDAIRLLGGV